MSTNHNYHIRLHLQRFSWFTLVATGLLVVQLAASNFQLGDQTATLGQAVDMTSETLLNETNEQRSAHKLNSLRLNPQLTNAATEKALDMVQQNYWSHNAPDGKTPWYFIEAAGYEYVNAGENLAYGFRTSDGVVSGWMNSEKHRENLLGNYQEVGFGYANSDSFQGGSYTVVVAMYGTSLEDTIAAANVQGDSQKELPIPGETTPDQPSRVLAWQSIASVSAPWSLYASLAIMLFGTAGFIYTHRKLLRHSWQQGIKYAHVHPLVDAAILGAIATAIATASVGFIR
jgi:uncharacterized protein YkwD